MHDLLHELAQSISKQECFKFVGDEESIFQEIPETIRHLSIETSNPQVLKKVERFKNLRTLHIAYDSNLINILNEIFKVIGSIRLLHLEYNFELKMMPEEVGYFHHLRYLRFSALNAKLLPRSVSCLYHLQFIIFDDFEMRNHFNDYFQRDTSNLFNLRHLTDSKLKFPGIGKLKFLQKLEFNIKNENGYKIEELKYMNDLRDLELYNLADVRDVEEACKANLCDKKKLEILKFDWGHELARLPANPDLEERVLDNLQPHNYLKTLIMSNYMGDRSAIWLNEAHLINNLENIYLNHCLEWEILPPFGQLPFLKKLELHNMPKVKRLENKVHGNDMCCVFPLLETLSLNEMGALVDWFDVVDGYFPCLTHLTLSNCPNLQELPYLPPKLESLLIDGIGWKTFNCCNGLNSILLETLIVYNCQNLQELPYLPPKLKSLVIVNIGWKTLNCWSISKSIPLETLEVRRCPNITSISVEGEISKLESLIIEDLQSLQSLPSSLINIISSLEFVEMKMLPQLQEYPDLLLPLEKMKIKKLKLHPKEDMWLTIEDENDNRIEELEHMTEIRFLNIYNLKYVRDAQKACNAKLCDKKKLIHLSLNWAFHDIVDPDLDERVLDNLQPHNDLKKLQIQGYMGARSSIWMNEARLIINLEEIYLYDCLEWEILPPFGQLPFLTTLELYDMPKVKRIENKFPGNDMCCVFPSLQTLLFKNMEALVDWFDASVVDDLFPCLTILRLSHCPNLKELPYLPPKLDSLEIDNIGWKILNSPKIKSSGNGIHTLWFNQITSIFFIK